MATVVELPRLSDTMEEGVVARWRIKEGDQVKRGQVIAEIETDKATMEFESFDRGRVLKLVAEEGQVLPLGAPIAVLGAEGDDVEAALAAANKAAPAAPAVSADPPEASSLGTPAPVAAAAPPSNVAAPSASPAPVVGSSPPAPAVTSAAELTDEGAQSRVPASPVARRLARERGLPLTSIPGSGPNGRVIKADVEGAVLSTPSVPVGTPAAEVDEHGRPFVARPATTVAHSQMRRTIAKRMLQSQQQVPHFYLTIEIDMERASKLRGEFNVAVKGTKASFNDLLLVAAARSLRENPRVNASFTDGAIVEHGDIVLGFAVALEDGLVVPVVKYADQKTLRQISMEVRELGKRAKQRQLRPEEMTGSTFTVSNLGMFGISEFAAMVNPGEGAILAVGAVEPSAVVVDGELTVRRRMRATLSCDHKVVDGAVGAQFLATLRDYLEEPMRLFT
ncbi:MAG: 2-oxo acid dehydrogenase subunit E2 [Myxococcales bacterium FL481]|nr:MAG: 2-oxo acid dehydrogenase subunit E2 [Myxococcales bacterium FL481]